MTPDTPSNPEPDAAPPAEVPATVPLGASPAERYVAEELGRARRSLNITRIAGVVVLLLVGGQFLYITNRFVGILQPAAAAEIADGFIMQQIQEKGPDLAEQLKQKIPELIAESPNYLLREMPAYRENIEETLTANLTDYSDRTAPKLGQRLDTFLTQHKDDVKAMLAAGSDREAVGELGADLRKELMDYLKEAPPGGGESVDTQIAESLKQIRAVEAKMARLAKNKGLTIEEQKTRRAIAVLSSSIERHVNKQRPAVQETLQQGKQAITGKP